MAQFIATFIIFALVMGGMALGVIFANKPLSGSCSSSSKKLIKAGIAANCDFCDKPPEVKANCKRRKNELPDDFRTF